MFCHHASIIETRTLQSTAINKQIAEIFSGFSSTDGTKLSVIIKYEFLQQCPTAIDLSKNISFYYTFNRK